MSTRISMYVSKQSPLFLVCYVPVAISVQYKCGVPGATTSKTGLAGCTWSFGTNVPGYEDDLSPYLRLVLPVDYENVSLFAQVQSLSRIYFFV